MNDSSLRLTFTRGELAKTSLKLSVAIVCMLGMSACGALVNKQNSSPMKSDPSKATVSVPDDGDDDSTTSPTPTPAPTPSAPTKPCHRFVYQGGQYYEEQDDGQYDVIDVPEFHSVDEEEEFWRIKGGDCNKPPNPNPKPTKPGGKPTPAPTPVAGPSPTPAPAPVNTVKPSYYCKPDGNGNFDNSIVIMTGGNSSDPTNGSYVFGQGGGCINRPLREVWAVAMNNSLLTWDGTSNSSNVAASPSGVTKTFEVHYSATRKYLGFPFTVTWDMDWFHILQKGTVQDPEKILINFHRYQGTTHIPYWEGSIVIQRVTDQITGVYVRNQIHADQTGVDDATSASTQIVQKYRTGAPIWNELPFVDQD